MKKQIFLLTCLMLSFSFSLVAVVLTISNSGTYKLRENLSDGTSDSIINITASDVELDLGGYVVSQSSTGSGIEIQDGVSNVIIHHGVIRGTTGTGTGVLINASTTGCAKIVLDNLRIEDWATRAINFNGTVAITDSVIKDCYITGNTGTSGEIVAFTTCNRLAMSNCWINNNSRASGNVNIVDIASSSACSFIDVDISGNSAASGDFNGINLTTVTDSFFSRCSIIGNTASGTSPIGALNGIYLSSSTDNVFEDCMILGNSGSTGALRCFLVDSSDRNLFKRCIASSSSGTSAEGFQLRNASDYCLFEDCIALANSSSTSTASDGWLVQNAFDTHIRRCIALGNDSTTTARGFFLSSCTGCLVEDCIAARNGDDAAGGIGFNDSGGTNNRYIRNLAYRNSTGAQTSGVNDTATTQSTASRWENLERVTPA